MTASMGRAEAQDYKVYISQKTIPPLYEELELWGKPKIIPHLKIQGAEEFITKRWNYKKMEIGSTGVRILDVDDPFKGIVSVGKEMYEGSLNNFSESSSIGTLSKKGLEEEKEFVENYLLTTLNNKIDNIMIKGCPELGWSGISNDPAIVSESVANSWDNLTDPNIILEDIRKLKNKILNRTGLINIKAQTLLISMNTWSKLIKVSPSYWGRSLQEVIAGSFPDLTVYPIFQLNGAGVSNTDMMILYANSDKALVMPYLYPPRITYKGNVLINEYSLVDAQVGKLEIFRPELIASYFGL